MLILLKIEILLKPTAYSRIKLPVQITNLINNHQFSGMLA